MATPTENLANSLQLLKTIQDQGVVAITPAQLSRTHRDRLLKNGFLQEVMKGWYIAANPGDMPGESTPWYTSFWAFCAGYLEERFGEDWCLSPEQSLALATGDWAVPRQLIVRTPKGGNKPLNLPHGTSVFDYRLELPAKADRQVLNGLRLFSLPAALIAATPTQFAAKPIVMRVALATLTDASDVLGGLLAGGHRTIAGRLAGAFRNIGRSAIAGDIIKTMRAAGYTITESDPFKDAPQVALSSRETSPYVNRMVMLWQKMRADVLNHFPAPPRTKPAKRAYLRALDAVYVTDAYNSLSIEGYRVNAELIERVRAGGWNPDRNDADREHRDALAARGYWQAFQRVRASVEQVLEGANAGAVARSDHGDWYRELFGPGITAGLLAPADLAGYRRAPVYIRRSAHAPPNRDAVRELMPAFFQLLAEEKEAAVRVVLGHFIFVYIHPYVDGNGRIGRFLMNLMLCSGGYPWLVVPVDKRDEYMSALESASVDGNIIPFAKFLGGLLKQAKK